MIRNATVRHGGRLLVFGLLAVGGCATPLERSTRADLHDVETRLAPLPDEIEPEARPTSAQTSHLDGSLEGYLAYAFAHNPSLRASFEDWRAATERPAQRRRLPEPQISFAGFVRAVETRVGPQRVKLGAMQWFPWPSKLGAGGKAAARASEAAQREFEAHALEVAAGVARAYWALWQVQRTREVEKEQVVILQGLAEQITARLEVGGSDLADVAQIDLRVSRARDRVAGLDESERIAAAELVRAIGAPAGTATPVRRTGPAVEVPSESTDALLAEAARHPRVGAMAAMSRASDEEVRAARADRLPSFGVGVNWIITGKSNVGTTPVGNGKDAVAILAGLKLPLWGRSYGAAENESRARSAAYRARAIDARNRVMAEAQQWLARVRDEARRASLYEDTLVPQAEAVLESVVGSYATGRSTVAELLMSERELVDLQRELYQAQADYARDFAELERVVGRPVRTAGAEGGDHVVDR